MTSHPGYAESGLVLRRAATLEEAVKEAYRLSGEVDFANKYCRSDIGRKALAAQKERE